MLVEVTLLDGSVLPIEVQSKGTGGDLLDAIATHETVNLLEKDYFGLKFFDKKDNIHLWVQNDRRLTKQLKEPMKCQFQVRFYPPDPSQLHEDLTRYLLCLQIQQDVKTGKLPCSFVTHALLGAYLAQSEIGDYEPVDHGLTTDYIREFDFAPNQSEDLLERIMEVHKTLKGQSPAEAELHYLDNAKKLAMYGVSLQPARDSEGVDIMLGVCSSGILVYRDRLRINRFAWPKIIKISYKRNGFYIKIRPGEFEHFESTIGFKLENHKAAKRLWKICVEHHSFFRLLSPDQKEKPKFPRFGSRLGFRYSGRTQHQAKKTIQNTERTNPAFERTASTKHNNANTTSSQSMQGISPRHKGSPDDSKGKKRHTFATTLPDEVQRELEDAQNDRLNRTQEIITPFKDQRPVVPQPGTMLPRGPSPTDVGPPHRPAPRTPTGPAPPPQPASRPPIPDMRPRPKTPPSTNGFSSESPIKSAPAYSPAYPARDGPYSSGQPVYSKPSSGQNAAGARTGGLPPSYSRTIPQETTFDADESLDYEDSAAKRFSIQPGKHQVSVAASDDGVVDIDEMLGNTSISDTDESFQFSTTESFQRRDGGIRKFSHQLVQNLITGEENLREFSVAGKADSSPGDRTKAESVTTRTGMFTKDVKTGESSAVMESSTLASSQTTEATKAGLLSASITTSKKESSMSIRKESVMNSAIYNSSKALDAAEKSSEILDVDFVKEEGVSEGMVVSSQTISSKSRTVETTTYAIEQEGVTETHIEQKVTIQSDGDPIDHDEALAQAIQEATAMNPDFTVEKIEINQTTQDDQ